MALIKCENSDKEYIVKVKVCLNVSQEIIKKEK